MAESPAILLVILRWLHAVAAGLWLGGGLLVLALRKRELETELSPSVWGRAAGRTLRLGVAVFILTGALLATSRLTEPNVPGAYVAILAVKITLAFLMFWLAVPRRRSDVAPSGRPKREWMHDRTFWIIAMALLIYLISVALDELVERAALQMG